MISHLWLRALPILFLLSALYACASSPIAPTYRSEAQENLSLGTVLQNPSQYNGATVIWGGQIVQTNNTPQGTELLLLQMSLDSNDQPMNTAASQGRFIARTNEFLDPEIFKTGELVTIAGQISGSEERPLGNMRYRYPLLDIKQYHLWTPDDESSGAAPYGYGSPYYYGSPYPYYDSPYYDYDWYGGWDWYGYPGYYGRRRFEGNERRFESGRPPSRERGEQPGRQPGGRPGGEPGRHFGGEPGEHPGGHPGGEPGGHPGGHSGGHR